MKKIIPILASLLSSVAMGQDTSNLEAQVNAYWASSNYIAIITTIDTALQKDPHDLFALCLKHGYYMSVEEDFDQAKSNSSKLVSEVDARIQNAGGAVYDLAKATADMERPKAKPPDTLINQERMAFRHKEDPSEFPFINMYKWFCDNLDKYENMKKESQQEAGVVREPRGESRAPQP